MGAANEQIRVSETVKRKIERRRRGNESYNDVLERVLTESDSGDFEDGFGRWSSDEADRIREERRKSKAKRKRRMRDRTADSA